MRVLITGASGYLGRALVRRLNNDPLIERLCVLSRDEHKIHALASEFESCYALRTFVGCVRDAGRMRTAMQGVDAVIHAAALKRIDAVINESIELDKTNVQGTVNVLNAALESGVRKVLFVSSDKAAMPCNAYGASKMMAECHAIGFNAYSLPRGMAVSAVRYGNVAKSTGSVFHIWSQHKAKGEKFPLTDYRMTRFHITIEQAVEFCISSLHRMVGGEIFVPDLPAYRLTDLAKAMGGETVTMGLRPGGEKLAEVMLSMEEPSRTLWQRDRFIITPAHRSWSASPYTGTAVTKDPHLSSDWPDRWLTVDQLKKEFEW